MILAALAAFSSCKDNETPEPEPEKPSRDSRLEVVSDNGLFVPESDGVSASLNFKNAGGEVVVSVSTNMENWTYSVSDDSWLDVSSDKHYLTLSAGRNESAESRKSAVTVTAADNNDNTVSYVINVSQNYAGQPEIALASNSVRFPAAGELSSVVAVETNQDELSFDCTCQWLLVEKTDGGLKFTVDQNVATAQRFVDLKLKAGAGKDAAEDVIRISQDGKAYLDLSSYVANASQDGGQREIVYESNPELGITFTPSSGESWFSVEEDKDAKTVKVKLAASPDGKQREGYIDVLVGEKENTASGKIRVLQIGSDTESLIFEVAINDDNYLFKNGGVYTTSAIKDVNVTINWGDGSEPETFVNTQPSHKYAKAGKYIVETKGSAPAYCLTDISTDYFTLSEGVMHVNFLNIISWGKLGVTTMSNVCKTDQQLETIADDVCGSFENVTDFTDAFVNCYSLKAIPANLFRFATKATTFQETFGYTASLSAIPEDLFVNCPEVTTFAYCFRGAGTGSAVLQGNGDGTVAELKPFIQKGHRITIPEGLFRNNLKVTEFTQVFRDMNITTVPVNLFANNEKVTTFNGLFTGCTELETIPADLFAHNKAVANFGWLFHTAQVKTLPVGLFKYCDPSKAITINQMFQEAVIDEFPEGFFEGLSGTKSTSSLFESATFLKPLKGGMFKGLVNVTSLSKAFYHVNVTTLPEDLFEGVSVNSTTLDLSSAFFNCAALESIPAGLLDPVAAKVTNLNSCFRKCAALKSVPAGFGNSAVKVSNINSMFYECTGLETLPSEMLKGSAATLNNCGSAFNFCTSIKSVPDGMFSHITAKNASFTYCFANCTALEKVGSEVFPATVSTTGLNYVFQGCTALKEISEDVFSKCVNVTNMMAVFKGCTSLTTVPAGIFSKLAKVTTFDQTFIDCTGLSSIPAGLFDGNTAATKFQKVFSGCKALKSVPAGLFAKNTKVTDFNSLFIDCSALETVPGDLFENCTAAQTFNYLFEYCSSLKSIPAGLFAKNTRAVYFNDTFAGCTSLAEIPAGLFDAVPTASTVASFKECFINCTSLKSIPTGLFDKALKAVAFNYAFANCTGLTGESPFTTVSGNKIHLYERKAYYSVGGFNNRITGTKCFSGCTGLSDYDNISSDWK